MVARSLPAMARPARFEHHRYLGDKRTQIAYDLDADDPQTTARVAEVIAAETFATFGPDTVAELRNRGYRLFEARRRADP